MLIDTNGLISFITDRNPDQQAAVAPIFESASKLDYEIICHQVVLIEFVYVLDKIYKLSKTKIKNLMHALLTMPGITTASEVDIKTVFSIWPNPIADFGDAIIAGYALRAENICILTFDRKFKTAIKKLNLPIHTLM